MRPNEDPKSRYYEDLIAGEERISSPRTITTDEIIEFAKAFDPQPFHVDPEAAKETIFGGIIASATHILALWRRLDHETNGDIRFICGVAYESVRLLRPLRENDSIRVVSKLLEKRISQKSKDRAIVRFEYRVLNQEDVVICDLKTVSLVRCRVVGATEG